VHPGTEAANGPLVPLAIPAGSSLPKVEIVASGAALPLKAAPSEVAESMLVPLVNQFGLMQQQMFDQFQQAMAMMVQMFGTMHRDQMEAIRSELAQLHELTQEFHALKQELADRTQERERAMPGESVADPRKLNPSARTSPGVSPRAQASRQSSDVPAGQADTTSPVQSPVAPSVRPEQRASAHYANSPVPSCATAPAAQTRSEDRREPDPQFQATAEGPNLRNDPDRNSILWLHERIMTLQRERETRWQKILKLLPGMS
jgi:hypothetical protein